jgi:hypothetical protein
MHECENDKNAKMKQTEKGIILLLIFSMLFFELLAQSKKQFIQGVQDYQNSVKLMHWKTGDNVTGKLSFDIDTNTFSLSAYLSYFNKLRLSENATPEYIFMDNSLDGSPILYVVKDNSEIQAYYEKMMSEYFPKNDTSSLNEEVKAWHKKGALIGFASDSLNNLRFNMTPENSKSGFLQYLFMNIHGESFALHWHSNYRLSHVITSKKELKKYFNKYNENIFEINEVGLDSLMNQKPDIKIKRNKDKCMITWYEFAPFAGYLQYIYSVERVAPYRINLERKKLQIGVTPIIIF